MAKRGQDFKLWAGDARHIVFHITDLEALEGCNLEWAYSRTAKSEPLTILKSTEGDIDVDGLTVTVKVPYQATLGRFGRYYHELKMADGGDNPTRLAVGHIRILPSLLRREE